MKVDQPFFVFDVESIGLHGEGFAVAGGIYVDGAAIREFCFACRQEDAEGDGIDRDWVKDNVPVLEVTHRTTRVMREAFWGEWMKAKSDYPDILMAGECLWPVEAGFIARCIYAEKDARNWLGPYPFHEIASFMLAAGMDPMGTYERSPSESPAHNPLTDARLSARLLAEAIRKLVAR